MSKTTNNNTATEAAKANANHSKDTEGNKALTTEQVDILNELIHELIHNARSSALHHDESVKFLLNGHNDHFRADDIILTIKNCLELFKMFEKCRYTVVRDFVCERTDQSLISNLDTSLKNSGRSLFDSFDWFSERCQEAGLDINLALKEGFSRLVYCYDQWQEQENDRFRARVLSQPPIDFNNA
tara:strand:- start:3546 stop:4100 length:555 start_codon:yes stop_codon:yes gene_type:complete